MSNPFDGKKIWLIGASTGIGDALAHDLSARGAFLALSGRDVTKLKALQAELGVQRTLVAPVDVSSLDQVEKAWQTILSEWSELDVLIYNAGAYEPMSALQFNLSETEKMLDINFRGALRVLESVLPSFVKKGDGHIVLVASAAAYGGLPNAIGYGASKAALLHLAENLRLDLHATKIKVQVVNPGFVKTQLTDKNTFKMPFMISPQSAATYIISGLQKDSFEIHFPKRFTSILKLMRFLPYPVYFKLLEKL